MISAQNGLAQDSRGSQPAKPDKSKSKPASESASKSEGSSSADNAADKAAHKANKALKKKENLQDFYRSELRKGSLAEERRAEYTTALDELSAEINAIRAERMKTAKANKDKDPAALEEERLSVSFREFDIAILDSAPPMILANEPKSLIFNAGVSFLDLHRYSAPFTISAEKILSEKLSVGGYFGHFLEKVIDDSLHLDSNEFFTSNKANYKHTYLNFGVKASYHFFKPTFFLPPTKFDPYVSAMLGYTLKTGTHPFLDNEEFLPYDADDNDVTPGEGQSAFLNPNKKGINFGIFGGLRYMHDDNLGFFVEAGYSNTAFATIGATIRFLDGSTKAGKDGVVVAFKVQILSSTRQKKQGSKSFKGIEGYEEIKTKKEYVYVVTGKSASFDDATDLQVELSGSTFKRSFVVAIKDGMIIKLEKGKKLMGIVDEEPEEEEDPFKKEKEEKEEKAKDKKEKEKAPKEEKVKEEKPKKEKDEKVKEKKEKEKDEKKKKKDKDEEDK